MSTQNIPFSMKKKEKKKKKKKKKITLNYPKSEAVGFFSRDSRASSKQPW